MQDDTQTQNGQTQPQGQWTQEQYDEYQRQLADAQVQAADTSAYTQAADPYATAQQYAQNNWAQPLNTDDYQTTPTQTDPAAVDALIAQEYSQMDAYSNTGNVASTGGGGILASLFAHKLMVIGLVVSLFVIGTLVTVFVKNGGTHSRNTASTSTSEDATATEGDGGGASDEELSSSDDSSFEESDDESIGDEEDLSIDDTETDPDPGETDEDPGETDEDPGETDPDPCDATDSSSECYVPPTKPDPKPPVVVPPKTATFKVATYSIKGDMTPAQVVSDVRKIINAGADIVGLQGALKDNTISAINNNIVCASCAYAGFIPAGDAGDTPLLWKKARFTPVASGSVAKATSATTIGGTAYPAKFVNGIRLKSLDIAKTFFVFNNHGINTQEKSGKPTAVSGITNIFNAQMVTLKNRIITSAQTGDPIIVTGLYYVNYRTDSQVKYNIYPFANTAAVATRANWQRLGTINASAGTADNTSRLADYVHSRDHARLTMKSQQILTGYTSTHSPVLVTFDMRDK